MFDKIEKEIIMSKNYLIDYFYLKNSNINLKLKIFTLASLIIW